jgi:hypothetical protein
MFLSYGNDPNLSRPGGKKNRKSEDRQKAPMKIGRR